MIYSNDSAPFLPVKQDCSQVIILHRHLHRFWLSPNPGCKPSVPSVSIKGVGPRTHPCLTQGTEQLTAARTPSSALCTLRLHIHGPHICRFNQL